MLMPVANAAETVGHALWADQPVMIDESAAKNLRTLDTIWSKEVFPIGNGRLGCTVFGTTDTERIQFNEDSLWVGNEHRTGGYQPFGDVYVKLGHDNVSKYRRELDLSQCLPTDQQNLPAGAGSSLREVLQRLE